MPTKRKTSTKKAARKRTKPSDKPKLNFEVKWNGRIHMSQAAMRRWVAEQLAEDMPVGATVGSVTASCAGGGGYGSAQYGYVVEFELTHPATKGKRTSKLTEVPILTLQSE